VIKIGFKVYITEGCRLTRESALLLVEKAEQIFRKNGFQLSFDIISVTYIEKILDNGLSIFDFDLNLDGIDEKFVNQNPHFFSVERHKELLLFPENNSINLVLVKSLHNTGIDSYPSNFTFKNTNTIFISESCMDTSLAHSLLNHFGVENQYYDPKCLSYGSDLLRRDSVISEDEKLQLSPDLIENESVKLL